MSYSIRPDVKTRARSFLAETVCFWGSPPHFIRELAGVIVVKLKVNRVDVDKYFVRTDQVEAITDLLAIDSGAVGFLGIYVLGGTADAKDAFNNLCFRFQGCSFLEDVRESLQNRDPVKLQKQLLSDILYRFLSFLMTLMRRNKSMN